MAVEKVSPSFERALAERARRVAEARDQSISAFVAGAVEHRLKLDEARGLLQEWQPSRDHHRGRASPGEVEVAG